RRAPAVPPAGHVPDVDHLGPPAGDAHRVPGPLEHEVDLLGAGCAGRVLHVRPGAQADDVDDLVQVERWIVLRGHGVPPTTNERSSSACSSASDHRSPAVTSRVSGSWAWKASTMAEN